MPKSKEDFVRFELCFVDTVNNIQGYVERSVFDDIVKKWEARGKKPPKGQSRCSLFGLRKQQEQPPEPVIRFELDAVVKIVEFPSGDEKAAARSA